MDRAVDAGAEQQRKHDHIGEVEGNVEHHRRRHRQRRGEQDRRGDERDIGETAHQKQQQGEYDHQRRQQRLAKRANHRVARFEQ